MEPKGFEMNQSKGTFSKNQNFLQICRYYGVAVRGQSAEVAREKDIR